MAQITVFKGRTTVLPVKLSYDISQDLITSQIRKGRSHRSELIAEWTVSHLTDGTDGELIFSLDDSETGLVTAHMGYMDIKRVTGGEPVPVLDDPIVVNFRNVVTE